MRTTQKAWRKMVRLFRAFRTRISRMSIGTKRTLNLPGWTAKRRLLNSRRRSSTIIKTARWKKSSSKSTKKIKNRSKT